MPGSWFRYGVKFTPLLIWNIEELTSTRSRIKFRWYPNSQTFPQPGEGEIDFLNNVPTLQDCANHCAVNANCKASVWDDVTHDCRLMSNMDGCQDEEPSSHSLWRVGFIDVADDKIGCSQKEIDAKCADKQESGRLEAEKECTTRSTDLRAEIARLQAENSALRAAKNQAERELAETKTDRQDDHNRLNRQCQDKLNEEIEKRRKAVKDAREDAERNCRSKQDNDLRIQLDDLRTECDSRIKADEAELERIESQCIEDRKRCADDYDSLSKKCANDLSKANQQQKDSDNKCKEATQQKDDQIRQCTENLKTVKDQQKQCENQCQADKANLKKDCDNVRNNDKMLLKATCQAEKDIINRQCAYDLNSAKEQQKQSENKCQAEKDVINKQCTRDVGATKAQQQQQLESKCKEEKDKLDKQCNDRLANEQKISDDTCQRQKEELRKDCEDRCKTQARGKDEICYNPGFGAWPTTIPAFNVDDINYVLKPNTNLRPGYSKEYTSTSPASCARDYCNDASDCVAIRWDINNSNTCHVFIDSPYSPFEKSRLREFSNSYMIVKSDRM
ncbi:hypothetical protein FPOA_12767 [Fusarium poae]|uniref:Apple domain-containing protein n=1 Tax=Fusarium poae TaxID=36050 RepID=A0A1B8A811_FUSPO|nr:hypothetical protein FPOA_12767 [Fusarium poae]